MAGGLYIGLKGNAKKRGFAALSPEKRREISSRGGKAAHAKGKAHKWNSEEAVKAAKKKKR